MDRYFVDSRIGCVAIRDRTKTDPDYQGLHEDTQGVVWYRHGICMSKNGWEVGPDIERLAHLECNEMNRKERERQPELL